MEFQRCPTNPFHIFDVKKVFINRIPVGKLNLTPLFTGLRLNSVNAISNFVARTPISNEVLEFFSTRAINSAANAPNEGKKKQPFQFSQRSIFVF